MISSKGSGFYIILCRYLIENEVNQLFIGLNNGNHGL